MEGLVTQGPLVLFMAIVIWHMRKDLLMFRKDNHELVEKVLEMHEKTLEVVNSNTQAQNTLAEKINDIER